MTRWRAPQPRLCAGQVVQTAENGRLQRELQSLRVAGTAVRLANALREARAIALRVTASELCELCVTLQLLGSADTRRTSRSRMSVASDFLVRVAMQPGCRFAFGRLPYFLGPDTSDQKWLSVGGLCFEAAALRRPSAAVSVHFLTGCRES